MTAILAVRDKKKRLYLAGERQIVAGTAKYDSPIPKILKRDNYLLGAAGSGYLCSIVLSLAPLPPFPNDIENAQQALHFMYLKFLPGWISFLRHRQIIYPNEIKLIGGAKEGEEPDPDHVLQVLIGIENYLFELMIGSLEMHFDSAPTPFAIGCGGPFGLATLINLENSKLTLRKRLEFAFQTISKCDAFCGSKFDVIS